MLPGPAQGAERSELPGSLPPSPSGSASSPSFAPSTWNVTSDLFPEIAEGPQEGSGKTSLGNDSLKSGPYHPPPKQCGD